MTTSEFLLCWLPGAIFGLGVGALIFSPGPLAGYALFIAALTTASAYGLLCVEKLRHRQEPEP